MVAGLLPLPEQNANQQEVQVERRSQDKAKLTETPQIEAESQASQGEQD